LAWHVVDEIALSLSSNLYPDRSRQVSWYDAGSYSLGNLWYLRSKAFAFQDFGVPTYRRQFVM